MSGVVQGNPYSGYSTLATGPRFVGREQHVRELVDVCAGGRASRAIVGIPRVGKSSLAREAMIRAVTEHGVDTYWIDVGTLGRRGSIVESLLLEIDATPIAARESSFLGLKSLLRERLRLGRRSMVVLDEFDAARLLEDFDLEVRRLRELLIDPTRFGLTCILVCRRELHVLETQSPDLSNLSNSCPAIRLKPFALPEVLALCRRWHSEPDHSLVERVSFESAGMPLIAEEFLSHCFDGLSPDDSATLTSTDRTLLFEQVLDLLRALGLDTPLIDAAGDGLGPGAELGPLLGYGLVRLTSGRGEVPASEFRNFLLMGSRNAKVAWRSDG